MNVGLVGYGIMGAPIAQRLLDAGHAVIVVDPDTDALTRARALGCSTAATPAALAAQTSIILLSLPRPEHVRLVVHEGTECLLDGASEGSVIVDTSTVDPETSRQNAQIACLEEIAWENGWISDDQLREAGESMAKNAYGEYLLSLLR